MGFIDRGKPKNQRVITNNDAKCHVSTQEKGIFITHF